MLHFPPHHFAESPFWDELSFQDSHQQSAPVSIRLNPFKSINVFDDLEKVPWCDLGRYFSQRPKFTLDPLFHAGAYYVQESSSMFVAQAFLQTLTSHSAPLKVLDLCAAPGGKSTLLASLLRPNDLLVSNEVIATRAGILVENMTRWGQMNTWVTNNDPKDFGRAAGFFDVMLVDAPCSGSGLWRKDEKAISEWSEDNVKLCSERQKRILADAFAALAKDGILIYATCSFSKAENENILDWLMSNMPLESISLQTQAEWGITETQSEQHAAYGYRFYPWKTKGEGFFLAAFRRTDGIKTDSIYSSAKPAKHNVDKALKAAQEKWKPYLDTDFATLFTNETYYALHPEHAAYFDSFKSNFYIRKAGTALGQIGLKEIIPDHDLAMSVHLSKGLPTVDLSLEEALHYLKKESVRSDLGLKGWHIASYQNLALGWGKWMPNRMNNYLPKNLRIRMDIG